MKLVTAIEETKILNQLAADIEREPERAAELNAIAIKRCYKSEPCARCGEMVSDLIDGLCGGCRDEDEEWRE